MATSNHSSVTVHELVGTGDSERLEAFLKLYAELMVPYAHYVPRMRERAQRPADDDPRFVEHYLLLEVDGQPAGFTHFKYVTGRRCGIGLDLGVLKPFRDVEVDGRKLGRYINWISREQLLVDAEQRGDATPAGLMVEVGTPKLIEHYQQYGFYELPLDYYEPSVPSDREVHDERFDADSLAFNKMQVGLFPCPGVEFDPTDQGLITDLVKALYLDHYGLSEDHWAVQRTLASVQRPGQS